MVAGHPFAKRHRLPLAAYQDPEATFHITIRALPDTRPFAKRGTGDIVWASLREEIERGRVVILAMCLMPDHLHVIARPAELSVVRWVGAVKSWTTRIAEKRQLWQPSFHDRRLRNEAELLVAIAYARENPVRAGLVDDADAWPWTFVGAVT